jgi:hypothetical protein
MIRRPRPDAIKNARELFRTHGRKRETGNRLLNWLERIGRFSNAVSLVRFPSRSSRCLLPRGAQKTFEVARYGFPAVRKCRRRWKTRGGVGQGVKLM